MSNLKIFKYQLAITDQQIIEIPLVEKLLCVQLQGSVPTLWAVVNADAPRRNVEIRCYGTGLRSPEADDVYLGTVQENAFVWHYFAAAQPNDPANESKSRERFEKWATENKLVGLMIGLEFADGNYVAEQLAKRWPTWRAAERDTRERCAQVAEDVLKQVWNIVREEPQKSRYHRLGESVAEAIRKGGE